VTSNEAEVLARMIVCGIFGLVSFLWGFLGGIYYIKSSNINYTHRQIDFTKEPPGGWAYWDKEKGLTVIGPEYEIVVRKKEALHDQR
jgi:hypothetical protein